MQFAYEKSYELSVFQRDEKAMTKKITDLSQYRTVKADYQKLLEQNPYTILSFKDYFKVREFLEKVHRARLRKKLEQQGK